MAMRIGVLLPVAAVFTFGQAFQGQMKRASGLGLHASWNDFEEQLCAKERPTVIDSVLTPNNRPAGDKIIFYRERHGWCPYSERVWFALEYLGAEYDTVLIDNTGGPRPNYFGGQTPQIKWLNGQQQSESMDLVCKLDEMLGSVLASHEPGVQQFIRQFSSIFPRARPSSRAAFLFQYNGDPLWKSTFEKTLQGVDDLLTETEGPYFGGSELTAADICYLPFLERYRYQLPCLHQGLEPCDEAKYPNLYKWYQVMDQNPVYMSRVRGNASSWRKVLSMAGFGNDGVPPTIEANMEGRKSFEYSEAVSHMHQDLWRKYAKERSYVGETPQAEAARIITSNRVAIITDATKRWKDANGDETHVDASLLKLATTLRYNLVEYDDESVSLAQFLDERMCVPRDMGVIPAAYIKKIAFSQTYVGT